jgi:tRNA dimethylallyltransferase
MKNKVIFVVGPTAVGKTGVAFKLAKIFNGELINADSVQIYKSLDIISGKDIPTARKLSKVLSLSSNKIDVGFYTHLNIPIFLLDVVSPSFSFSVSHFQNLSKKVVQLILNKKKVPIVVGGTGLYINSLTVEMPISQIKPNLKLRESLKRLDIKEMQKELRRLDNKRFETMNYSDLNNPRRLMRAIEISESRIKNKELRIKNKTGFEYLIIGLKCERGVLKKRIDARVEDRLKNGALKEAEELFVNYENLSPQVINANGYRQLFQYLKREIDFEEAIYRWKISEYHHAKNQMTWFKKYGDIKWFDIEKKGFEKNIENKVKEFLN